MLDLETSEHSFRETATKIGEALAYLSREAQAAGLETLATEIGSAEAIAYETARHSAYLDG